MDKDITLFANFCETELHLHQKLRVEKRKDPNETFYKSLPVCIIDAVFSIGVKYTSVEKATNSFLRHFNLNISRTLPVTREYTIRDFMGHMESFSSFEEAAATGFHNRQRTSSRNGILKAEACYQVAKVFRSHRIDTLAQFQAYPHKTALDEDILQVHGQSSGIMLKYLYMLAGKADEVKPDRHMVNFMRRVFPELTIATRDHDRIKAIMLETVAILNLKYPQLTPRFLDCLIWEHMRQG